ncbi:MAG: proline-rich domain-containing protein [Hydrogenophaga sp.]|nr:proline-rich domain-containing protein [Hydrogenophaga sp.]
MNLSLAPMRPDTTAIETLVNEAAARVSQLLIDGDMPQMKQVLTTFAQQLAPPPGTVAVPVESAVALRAMKLCTPMVRAHLLGACHFLHHHLPHDAPWRCALRDDVNGTLQHLSVLAQYLPLPSSGARRVETIQAIFVQLSWLAPDWHEADVVTHEMHTRSLRAAVRKLWDTLEAQAVGSKHLISDALFQDFKAALVPACCSALLARVTAEQFKDDWMERACVPLCEVIEAGVGEPFFPADGPVKRLSALDVVRRANVNSQLIGSATTTVVNEAIVGIERLVLEGTPAALRESLETLADVLKVPYDQQALTTKDVAALEALLDCENHIVRAHIMGLCHFRGTNPPSSLWKRKLRHDTLDKRMSMKFVVTAYKDDFVHPLKRGAAIKGAVVHLSWLAMSPQPSHAKYVMEALAELFRELETAHFASPNRPERSGFLHDVLAAIEPRFCSPWLVAAFVQCAQIPVWLEAGFRAALKSMEDYKHSELFQSTQARVVKRHGERPQVPPPILGMVSFQLLPVAAAQVPMAAYVADPMQPPHQLQRPLQAQNLPQALPLVAVPAFVPVPLAQSAPQSGQFRVPARPADGPPQPDVSSESTPPPPQDVAERWMFFLANPARIVDTAMRQLRIDILEQAQLDQPGGLRRLFVQMRAIARQRRSAHFKMSDSDRVSGFLKLLVSTAERCRPGATMPWVDARAFWRDVKQELNQKEMASLRRCLTIRVKGAPESLGVPADIVALLTAPMSAQQAAALQSPIPSDGPLSIPLTEAEQDAMRDWARVSVERAATQLEQLLAQDPVDAFAVKQLLWTLSTHLAPALSQPPAIRDVVLKAALLAMSSCPSIVVRAHLMGACHYLHVSAPVDSVWRSGLRGEENPSNDLAHSVVLNLYKEQLQNKAQRADALKAVVAHLSWLAPAWSKVDPIQHKSHMDALRMALRSLFDALEEPYAGLGSDTERAAFLEEVLAAFGPATCSRLLAKSLAGVQGIPLWLDDSLLAVRESLLTRNAVEIFPPEQSIAPLSRVDLVTRSDAPDDMVRESITSMVNEAATSVKALLLREDYSALSETLEAYANALAATLALPGNPAVLTRAQKFALQAMLACDPAVRAYLMGVCSYLHTECPASALWRRELRFERIKSKNTKYEDIFDGYRAAFADPSTRAGAIKGVMVHLSWVVSSPLPTEVIGDGVRKVLDSLFQALVTESSKAMTSDELTVFREDFLAAIVPECCSSALIAFLANANDVPPWLKGPLNLTLGRLKVMGGQFFPKLPNALSGQRMASHMTRALPLVLPRLPPNLQPPVPARQPVPLAEVPRVLTEESLRIGRLVKTESLRIELLLTSRNLDDAHAALKAFATELRVSLVRDGQKLADDALFAWQMMVACKPFVAAHLLGACHYFHAQGPIGLQRESAVPVQQVVDRHMAQLQLREKRTEAFRTMLADLSWLAPASYMPALVEERHKASMGSAAGMLVRAVQASYAKLQSLDERATFREEMAAAFGPACCSPLLARYLKAHVLSDVSPLLKSALLSALLKIEVGNLSPLFPSSGKTAMAKSRNTHPGSGEAPAAVAVDGTAHATGGACARRSSCSSRACCGRCSRCVSVAGSDIAATATATGARAVAANQSPEP